MLFNSYEFLFGLLPLACLGYFLLRGDARLLLLTLLSFLFYGWWDYRFVGLMLTTITIDYTVGRLIGRASSPRARRGWLLVSIVANLSLLGFFKYFDLFASSTNAVAMALGLSDTALLPILHIVLPVGISFYTFQSMSYTIDVYRGVVEPQRSYLRYAFYVSFFPQLVAGPIVRYRDIADQMSRRDHSPAILAAGASLFVLGLGKKLILADGVAPLVDVAFGIQQPGFVEAWVGVLAYTMQIYYDFSAYSDMAVGLGLMFGFRFPQNFNSPYKAISITDFWRRWHMSLSTWLRDYLYIPLGGNRKGAARTYLNLFLTMLLGGLWHGANWTFVVWGAYHGVLLAIEKATGLGSTKAERHVVLRRATTFVLAIVGWVFFRSVDMAQAGAVLSGMAGLQGLGLVSSLPAAAGALNTWLLGFALLITWSCPNSWQLQRPRGPFGIAVLVLLFVACVFIMLVNASSPFLYFQF